LERVVPRVAAALEVVLESSQLSEASLLRQVVAVVVELMGRLEIEMEQVGGVVVVVMGILVVVVEHRRVVELLEVMELEGKELADLGLVVVVV
jgi:hypothetical protein